MDKETLLSKFKPSIGEPDANTQMYGDTGLSVRTLDTYLEAILPSITDDAIVTDDYVNTHVKILKSMGGQMRHEQSEFVKNYKPQTQQSSQQQDGALDELKKSVEELKAQLKGEQQKRSMDQIRSAVKGKAKELKVQNTALWNDAVQMTELKEGMDDTAFMNAVKNVYEEKLKSYFGNGASPYGGEGSGGNGGTADKEAAKVKREAFKARMQSQGKLPKNEQQD